MNKILNLEECIEKTVSGRDKFSLKEQFNETYADLNAVTLITPSQTVTCFTDVKKNIFGSGNHGEKYEEMVYAIYEEEIKKENDHQNIRIEYINFDYDPVPICQAFIYLPSKINLSQYKSLSNFNKEIIKLQKEKNNIIKIYVTGEEETIGRNLLDISDLLLDLSNNKIKSCIIDDKATFEYQEKHLIGYPNEENHYNDSEFIVGNESVKTK